MPDSNNNIDNIDLKIIPTFTFAYQDLYEKGELSARQLDSVLSLIDSLQNYSVEEFQERLKQIFPE